MRKVALLSAVALVTSACASSSPEPAGTPEPSAVPAQAQKAAFDPVGTYDYTTVVDASQVSGTFEIARKDDGGYTGRILSTMFPEIPISRVTVDGNKLILAASMDGQPLMMELNFTGDTFTGSWSFGDGSVAGSMSGRKQPR